MGLVTEMYRNNINIKGNTKGNHSFNSRCICLEIQYYMNDDKNAGKAVWTALKMNGCLIITCILMIHCGCLD